MSVRNQLRQIPWLRRIAGVRRVPGKAWRNAMLRINPPKDDQHLQSLLPPRRRRGTLELSHLAVYTRGNAGDNLLPTALRDAFETSLGPIRWRGTNVRRCFTQADIAKLQRTRGVIIGGGGLFLRDTNPNENSGWQWNCSIPLLRQIDVPMVLFAVGYNRFRGQPEFEPIFTEHITALAEKCVYFGLRNRGSVAAVQSYLPADLREKVRFQPCLTTLLPRLYPHIFEQPVPRHGVVALNCAFDRSDLRFGTELEDKLRAIARAMLRLGRDHRLAVYAHMKSDLKILPYLDELGVEYELVQLYDVDVDRVIDAYRRASVAIGMRGHAQLIAYGCQTPVISLAAHDKLVWFCRDVGMEEWCVDIAEPSLDERLVELVGRAVASDSPIVRQITTSQADLWEITRRNIADFANVLGFRSNGDTNV